MKKAVYAAITGLAGIAFAAPALAQDVDKDPFDGFYVGVTGGYDVQPNDVGSRIRFDRDLNGSVGDFVRTSTGADAFSTGFCNGRALTATRAPGGCANDEDGWSYYARAGADTQTGPFVIGFVAEFGKSEISDSVSAFSTTPANYVMTREVEWEGGARGRVGMAADNTLFYGMFGAGYARIDRQFTTTNTANAFTERGKRNQWGGQAGGGVEQRIGNNFSFGLEYLFHRYEDNDYRVLATRGTAPATNPFVLAPLSAGTDFARGDTEFRWHSIRATAAFRF